MILKTLLIMALLLNAADALSQTVSGNLSVTVTPPGSAAVNPPAQAVAAGYTTLATNQDFTGTAGIDIACNNAKLNEPGHFWYTSFNGLLYQPNGCAGITWPATDPATGTGALRVSWTSANPGFQQGRVGLASSNVDSSYATTFPMKMYMESQVRFANTGYIGAWYSTWDWRVHDGNGDIVELDIEEIHGAATSAAGPANQFVGVAGGLNWGNGFTQNTAGYFANTTYDANIYHKWGELITVPSNLSECVFNPTTPKPNGSPCFKMCAYLDDNLLGCGYTPIVGTEAAQRNVLQINVTTSCGNNGNGDYGSEGFGLNACIDIPITGVASNGAGGTRVTTGRDVSGSGSQAWPAPDKAPIKIIGTNTSADGLHTWKLIDGTHFDLLSAPFTGTFSGTGTVNPSPIEMYVKSYRVWSCAAWQTTNC